MKFTILFLSFMLIMGFQRIWETFFKKIGKEEGLIIKKWTLVALTTLHFAAGILTVVEYFVFGREINFVITTLGFTMYFLGLIFRKWSIRALGKYHSIHIEIRSHHPLIKEGPYQYLRHPYYLGVIFELLGFPLVPNAYYAFCFSLFAYVPLLFIRLYFEEKAMIEKFGETYLLYKRETWGLFPFRRVRSMK